MLFFSKFLDMTQNTNRNVATVCRIKEGQTHPLAVICYPFYFFSFSSGSSGVLIKYWCIQSARGFNWERSCSSSSNIGTLNSEKENEKAPRYCLITLRALFIASWIDMIIDMLNFFFILNEWREEKKFQTTKLNKRCIIFRVELLMNTKIYIPN